MLKIAHLDSHKRGFRRLHDKVARINLVRLYLSWLFIVPLSAASKLYMMSWTRFCIYATSAPFP